MKCNVGSVDRDIRFGVGFAALALGLFGPFRGRSRFGMFALSAMEFITAKNRYCPISEALGVNTCEPEQQIETESKTAPSEVVGSGI